MWSFNNYKVYAGIDEIKGNTYSFYHQIESTIDQPGESTAWLREYQLYTSKQRVSTSKKSIGSWIDSDAFCEPKYTHCKHHTY